MSGDFDEIVLPADQKQPEQFDEVIPPQARNIVTAQGPALAMRLLHEAGQRPLLPAEYTPPYLVGQAAKAILPESTATKIYTGEMKAVGDVISSFTSPENLALLGVGGLGKVAQRLIAGTFSAQAAAHAPEAWEAFNETNDPEAKTRIAIGTIAGIGLPLLGMKGERTAKGVGDAVKETLGEQARASGFDEIQPASPDVQTEARPTGIVPAGGGIPIEGLPAEAKPPVALEATPLPFQQDPNIPFLVKVRMEDSLRTQGLNEQQIAALSSSDAGALYVQTLQRGGEPPSASEITSPESLGLRGKGEAVGQSPPLRQQGETPQAGPPEPQIPPAETSQEPNAPLPPAPVESPEETVARRTYEEEQLQQYEQTTSGQGKELLQAIQDNGGLPPANASDIQTSGYRGELRNVAENARGGAGAKGVFNLFRNDALPIDQLTSALRAEGFPMNTPNDLLEAVNQRLRTGKPVYGQPAEGERMFASGAAAPKARSNQGQAIVQGAAAQPAVPGMQPHVPIPRPPGPAPAPPPTPIVNAAVAPVRSWWQERTLGIRKLVAPQTIDAPARKVANIVRDYNGHLANRIIQADHAFAGARKDFDRTPVPSSWKYDPAKPLPRNYAFMAESERGGRNLSPEDRQLKAQLDGMFSEAVDEVHRVKPAALQSLIQDYFPHIWKDPQAARQAFASIIGTRPLEGSKGFLKQRSLAYVEDGLKLGLKPISDNPIDISLTKLHEVHKFVAAQDMVAEAKAIGARKFVYIFEKAPDGWVKVDDPTSTVHGPPFVTVPEAFDEQMKVKTVEVLDKLGVPHERLAKLGGKRWGTASDAGTPPGRIRTKFAGPLSVYWHELGHVLEFRYHWLDDVLRGERAGGQSAVAKELRALADMRSSTQPPPKSFQKYIRSADEKAAVMLEAYMHAPQRMQQEAPIVYGRVKKFIAAHPELGDIEKIRPSLVLGQAKAQIPVGGMVTLGHYYMPEGAAQVFNNYLSPGLQRFGIIRNIRQSTNILSGMQLGFSAFHAGFTSIDAAVSQFALGIRYASEGKIGKAVPKLLTAPAAPITNYLTGLRVQRAMLEPGTQAPHIEQIAKLAVQAGLRATVDPFWKTQISRNMIRAWHEGGVKGYAGTMLRAPFAASEQMMRPILEYLVPRQKLGVFAGMAQAHMERLGPNADVHAIRDAMARAADATEDRMGQMTYDNLFYSCVIRDAALMGFRAYGWTYGKYRSLFGGLADIANTRGRLSEGGPLVTDRMAYLLALPMVAAGIGSTMNYFMTGQAPQDWKDALMPRTGKLDRNGNPQRLSLPTYLKDILSDWHDFPDTKKMLTSVGHKLNPWFAIASDVINNADFYNTKVFNEDDPFWKRQVDKLRFVQASARPFAVTSTLKLNESNPTLMQQVLPFFGFVPAKSVLSMSPAQIRAAELFQDTLPKGARTQDQANHSKLVSTLARDMKEADPNWQTGMSNALASGQIRPADLQRMITSLPLTPLQYQVKKLEADAAMKVWDLASAQERSQLRTIVLEKIASPKNKLTPEERMRYFRVLNAPK